MSAFFDLLKNIGIRVSIPLTTYLTGDAEGEWHSVTDPGRNLTFVVQAADSDGTVTVQAWEATDSSGTGAQTLGASYLVTLPNTDTLPSVIQVPSGALSDGFSHVSIIASVAGTDAVLVGYVLYDSAYTAVSSTLNVVGTDLQEVNGYWS